MRRNRAIALTSVAAFLLAALVVGATRGDRPAVAADGPLTATQQVMRAEEVLRANPRDDNALANLAAAALQRAKETADSGWYRRADDAARRAVAVNPDNVLALESAAALAAARHRFDEAIGPATRALALAPDRFAALETLTDAHVELGNYREGFDAATRRLELRPDLSSYSRASYAAELRGDHELAVRLMALAADAGRPGSADRTWAQVQLGLLRLSRGDVAGGERDIRAAARATPDDPTVIAGRARVAAARGELAEAAALYRQALAAQSVAGYATGLAEAEAALGRPREAARARALARRIDDAEAASGVLVALDGAAADADFAPPGAAAVAAARRGHRTRTGVVGDDALGWVLTRSGRCDEGLRYARRALRLGAADALVVFHAGYAARCAGRRAEALRHMRRALALNPRFSVRWAPAARAAVRELAER